MKKRLLALLLIITMLISVAPTAFALEIPDVSNLDTGKVQTSIKELSEYINEKLDYDDSLIYEAVGGDYEVNSDSYYVSLGDSSVIGMNADNGGTPEGFNNRGYKTLVPASFPYKLAKKLGLDVETQYIQLALAGMRTNDLRYILDESFSPDAYALDRITERIDTSAGGIDAMRADYREALAKADLITLAIGNNNISYFIGAQLLGHIAQLLKANETLMGMMNGPMGDQIKTAVEEYIDIDAPLYELDWDSYLDAEGMAYVDSVIQETKSLLTQAGIPEIFTIDLGEMIQPMLDEQFGQGLVSVSILQDIPIHQFAADMMESCIYGYISHVFSYGEVVAKIREYSDAQLVLLSLYNPMEGFVLTYEDVELQMGEFIGNMLSTISSSGLNIALHSEKTVFAPLSGVETNFTYFLGEEGYTIDIANFFSAVLGGDVDYHATEAGHATMAEQVYKVLTVTKSETEPEPTVNPFKDVVEKDYFFEPVMWAVENGITSGLSADTFGATKGCTRAQVVTFLWRAAGEPAPKSSANPFTDVKAGQYYCDAVLWAVENGITTGLSATTFGPNENCNRGQIATFLWRAMGKPATTNSSNPFSDVSAKQYYYDAVLWAVEKGITTGLSATSFGPNSTCTRGQIVTFLYRAYK